MNESSRRGRGAVWAVRCAGVLALVLIYHGTARLGGMLAASSDSVSPVGAGLVVAMVAAVVVAVLATERRWLADRLRDAASARRELETSSADVVAELDLDGRILRMNRAFEGHDRETLVGQPLDSVVEEADRRALHDAIDRAKATGSGSSLEVRVRSGTGAVKPFHVVVTRRHGGASALLLVARDQTELHRVGEELERSLACFDALCAAAPVGVFRTTTRGDCTSVNDRWSEITGLGPSESMGVGWASLIESDPLALLEKWEEAADRGEIHESRHRVKMGEGDVRWLLCRALPVRDRNGSVRDYLGCFVDLTEEERGAERLRQAREEAEQVARVNGEFLARLSREVRTSLNSVIGMSQLLLSSDLTPEQREYSELVHAAGENLLSMLTNLLDFSKIDSESIDVNTEVFNVRNELENIVSSFAQQAHNKGLELVCAFAPTIPYEVAGDVEKLRQALANLISNAVSFTERGRVVLRVTPERTVADYAFLRFEVEDTGPGISEEGLSRVFQPFAEIGPRGRRRSGTGLGLAMARRLVQVLGGDLQVRSRLGRGTTFSFSIKVEVTRLRSEGSAVAGTSLEGRRVIVVDNDPVVRGILCSLLEGWGVEVAAADSAEAALQRIRGDFCVGMPVDLVLTDLGMEPADGLELARTVRDDASLCDIKLVLMASWPELGGRQAEVRKAGFLATVLKPVRSPELLKCLVEVLSAKGEAFAEIPAEKESSATLTKPLLTHARVLVAEDNDINQRLLKRLLTRRGHHVEVVANGAHAIRAVSEKHWDLVLMDCQMPQIDGWEATKEIRQRESGTTRHVPIVAVTANALQGDRERCLDAGMDDYIAKPVRPEILDDILDRWLAAEVEAEATTA